MFFGLACTQWETLANEARCMHDSFVLILSWIKRNFEKEKCFLLFLLTITFGIFLTKILLPFFSIHPSLSLAQCSVNEEISLHLSSWEMCNKRRVRPLRISTSYLGLYYLIGLWNFERCKSFYKLITSFYNRTTSHCTFLTSFLHTQFRVSVIGPKALTE